MDPGERSQATAAAVAIATARGLVAERARVVQNSNKLSLHLSPCDVFARVARVGHEVAAFEVAIADRLAATGSPVAALDARVGAQPIERDGFVVTYWANVEAVADPVDIPAEVAGALAHLHAEMRAVDIAAPHFTDRVAEAQELVADAARTPRLADPERVVLRDRLQRLRHRITERGADEQLLHGEPHSGNVIVGADGPRFIDLETCCRGPIELDLAHVPRAVRSHYANVDHDLLEDCTELVLAMVAAWRADRDDQFPDGERELTKMLTALEAGPPWPTLDEM